MKRRVLIAAVVILLFPLLCRTAHADIIYTPFVDEFYGTHSGDCVFEDRYYTVAVKEGATGYVSPEDLQTAMTVEYRTEIYISYTYEAKDGKRYGLYDDVFKENGTLLPEEERKSGWIPLDQLKESGSGDKYETATQLRLAALCVGIPLAVSVTGMFLFYLYIRRRNNKKQSK